MLKVLSIDVYALLDPDTTLSFVTPIVDENLDTLLTLLHEL